MDIINDTSSQTVITTLPTITGTYNPLISQTDLNTALALKQNTLTAATNLLGIGSSITALDWNKITLNKPTNFQADWTSTVINKPTTFNPDLTNIYTKTEVNNIATLTNFYNKTTSDGLYLTSASASTTYQPILTFNNPMTKTGNIVSIDLSAYATAALLTSNSNLLQGNINQKENILTFTSPLSRATNTVSIDLSSYLTTATAASTYATTTALAAKENALTFSSPLTRTTNTIGIDLSSYATTTALAAKENTLTFSSPLTRTTNTIGINLSGYATTTNLASYLPLSGGQLTGNLGFGVAPSASILINCSNASSTAFQNIQMINNANDFFYFGIAGNAAANSNYLNNFFIQASKGLVLNSMNKTQTGAPDFIINNNSVGINTTAPNISYKLDVNGGANAITLYEGGVSLASKYLSSATLANYVLKTGDDMSGKLAVLNGNGLTTPQLGEYGGAGDRIILWKANASAYPYSLGMNGGTMWYSVPVNAIHNFYVNGVSKYQINSGGVAVFGNVSTQTLAVVDATSYTNQFQLLISTPTSTTPARIQTIQQGIGYSQNLILQGENLSGNVGIGTLTNITNKLTVNGNIGILGSATNALIFDDTTNDKKIQMNTSNGFGVRGDGLGFYSSGSFTFRNATLTTTIFSVDSAGSMSFSGTIFPGQGVSTSANIRGGTGCFGTTVSTGATLTINSSTQLLPRILLSGQEFYQPANSQATGIALLLGVNRTGNKQLWIADSTDLTQNATNPVLRLMPNNIDCLSTNGTRLQMGIGGNLYTGANGINIGMNTTSYKSSRTILTASGGSFGYNEPLVQITQTNGWDGNYALQVKGYANIGGDGSGSGLRINGEDTGNTIFQNGNNNMGLTVNNANMYFNTNGATRMTINNFGNVGIGTAIPRARLDVYDNAMIVRGTNEGAVSGVYICNPFDGSAALKTAIVAQGVSSWSRSKLMFCLNTLADNTTSVTPADARLTIDINGNVAIGQTSAAYPLVVSGTSGSYTITSMSKRYDEVGAISNTTPYTMTGIVAYLNGNVLTPGFYVSFSDERLKKEIEDLSNDFALQTIMKLKPIKYNLIDNVHNNNVNYGFSAQEVQKVLPEAVISTKHYLPNIFQNVDKVDNNNSNIMIDADIISSNLSVNDNIRIITHSNEEQIKKIVSINDNVITLDSKIDNYKDEDPLFLYGKEEEDIRCVNHNFLYNVNIKATQVLYEIIMKQQEEIIKLTNVLITSNIISPL